MLLATAKVSCYPGVTSPSNILIAAEINALVREQWASLNPAERAQYEALARASPGAHGTNYQSAVLAEDSSMSSPAKDVIKRELENEGKTQANPLVLESPTSADEIEEQSPRTIQLQALLKNAGPQMLESSVDEGVKVLDQLKVPLIAKMENDTDAQHWIQQIGEILASSYFRIADLFIRRPAETSLEDKDGHWRCRQHWGRQVLSDQCYAG